MIKKSFAILLAALLLFPLLVLLSKTSEMNFVGSTVWLPVLGMTLLQAFLSATLSLALGLIGALGLLSLTTSRWSPWIRTATLLPGFLPPLLVLSSVFLWADKLGWELRGLGAVVFVHALINSGICAVAIADLIVNKLGMFSSVSQVLGAGRWRYYRQIMLPLLSRDLLYIFTMVFALCVTSFSIPLVVGSADISLEVLIYESMKISKDWNQAFMMTVIQIVVIFLLFFPLQKSRVHEPSRGFPMAGYGWRVGLICPLFCALLSGPGLLWGLSGGVAIWTSISANFTPEFFKAFWGTFRITALTAVFVFGFLNVIVLNIESRWLHKLLSGYLAPSPVIVGFSLWSITSNTFWISEVKMAMGLSLVFLPALYRWKAASVILALKGQVRAARTMGASSLQVFRKLTFPQTVSATTWLAGVAAFWASGDFVLATILGFGHSTLGLLAESLIVSYQFELASLISLIIFAFGSFCLIALGGLGRVLDSKPLS